MYGDPRAPGSDTSDALRCMRADRTDGERTGSGAGDAARGRGAGDMPLGNGFGETGRRGVADLIGPGGGDICWAKPAGLGRGDTEGGRTGRVSVGVSR